MQKGDFSGAFAFTVGYSVIFVVASCTLVLYQPAAAGSGIPEIIGFLNGTKIKDIFKLQTLIVKFLSCAFAVGAGMPVGYEVSDHAMKRFLTKMMTISGSYDSFGQFSCRWYLSVQIRNLFILSTLLSFNLLNLAITRVKLLNSSVCSDSNCSL